MTQLTLDLEWPEGSYMKYMEYFGKTVKLTVPVDFWTDDWKKGMRSRTFIGRIAAHAGGGVCLQPPLALFQAPEDRALVQCIPLKNNMTVELVSGRPEDY